jgi:predicted Zn finger-like uncharacterized protein
MSLATRCSACSTVFRVQQDQLKASEGWVRCGRCGTVFSALEGLFDLERESNSGLVPLEPPPGAAPKPKPPIAMDPPPADTGSVGYFHDDDDDDDDASAADEALPMPPPERADPPARAAVDLPLGGFAASSADQAAAAASFTATYRDERDDEDDAALLTEHSGHHTTFEESAPVYTGPAPLAPSFVREAERAARWQRPVVRRLTIAAALALPMLLAAQVALHHRDLVAARWPGSADLLGALCAPLTCSVQAPRSLDAVSVESSGLTRVEGAPLYKLQVAVRNRADWAVAMPALDLTLTDPRGEIVTRRVLRAAELGGGAPDALAAGAEWSALATLDVGERRVTGYTIDLFYP